ncbi:MAG: FGGY-family carbohydrate kinase, partial [Myxococcales bacterium]|nr:FGGY-family carbohydrate kinase [Myxococcales bacterium]
ASRAVLARPEVAGRRVAAVAVTCHWAGIVAVDGEGKALRPSIIWMDSRGARYMAEHCGGVINLEGYGARRLRRWLRLTGGAPSLAGKEPTAHLLWLRANEPEIYAKAARFLEPKDWLNHRLTGIFAATYDSIALHWVTDNRDIDRVRYDPTLLEWLGVEREKLPDLLAATDVVGELGREAAADLGLDPGDPGESTGIKVVGGSPDVQTAAVGSGAVADGDAHLYVGTSSWISAHVRVKKTDLFHNMTALPSALPGRYFVANAQETAGACFEHLRDKLLFPDDGLSGPPPPDFWTHVEALARAAPAGSGGLIYAPWLYGERSPVADHTVRGGFHNLSLQSGRPELLRAVHEGVAYNNRWLLGFVERFIGRRCEPIRYIGGGASSRLWCQIMADVLDREIDQVAEPRACNARGAALLASVGLGHLQVEDIPARVPVAERFSPTAEHRELHSARFAEFLQIFQRSRPIHRRLNSRDHA